MKNMYIIGFLSYMFINLVNAWHSSLEFNLTVHNSLVANSSLYVLFESYFSNRDYFSVLSTFKNNFISNSLNSSVFIGARNNLYELRLPDLKVLTTLTWTSTQIDITKCLNRSVIIDKEECDNYIKLLLKLNKDTYKICSTNAFNPKCRYYHINSLMNKTRVKLDREKFLNETSGVGYVPLRANENKYIYNFVEENNYLYTGNSIDLNEFFSSINLQSDQYKISTNVDDNNWINRARFVNSFKNGQRIFFIFNEEATPEESTSSAFSMADSNQSRMTYSKISQICLNDKGAPLNSLRNIWTTYLKSKISCVYNLNKEDSSSKSLFYFDEIESMSEVHVSKKSYFYAVFTTSTQSITASAVCLFYLDQIMGSFHGDYKLKNSNRKKSSDFRDETNNSVPNPRPSECPNTLSYKHLIFSRKNVVMENEIISEAIIAETSVASRFLSIDVDFNVKSLDAESTNDVIFIGTDNGRILTFVINKPDTSEAKYKIKYTEELILLNESYSLRNSILNLKLYKNENGINNLIGITQNLVISAPAHYCELKTNITKCDNKLYPYCVWSIGLSKCLNIADFRKENYLKKNSQTFNKTVVSSSNRTNSSDFDTSTILFRWPFQDESDLSLRLYEVKDDKIVISISILLFWILTLIFLTISLICGALITLNIHSKLILKWKKRNEKLKLDRKLNNLPIYDKDKKVERSIMLSLKSFISRLVCFYRNNSKKLNLENSHQSCPSISVSFPFQEISTCLISTSSVCSSSPRISDLPFSSALSNSIENDIRVQNSISVSSENSIESLRLQNSMKSILFNDFSSNIKAENKTFPSTAIYVNQEIINQSRGSLHKTFRLDSSQKYYV